jgi:L-amino acid N-acyltransferase YncA
MIEIMKANVADVDKIIAARVDAFSNEVILYGGGPADYDNRDALLSLFETRDFYKVIEDGVIIGGMTCDDLGNNTKYIGMVFVTKEYQGKGIGTKAMNFLFNEFPDVMLWKLTTPYLSYKNHHFYEKLGFTKVGET